MKFSSFKKSQGSDGKRGDRAGSMHGSSLVKPFAHAGKRVHGSLKKKVDRSADVAMTGSKGGRVERQRKQERRIDMELRNYAYR